MQFSILSKEHFDKNQVESYQVRSVTSGREAMGEVLVRIREDEKSFTGRGVSTDIIEASAKSYLSALNQKEHYLKDRRRELSLPCKKYQKYVKENKMGMTITEKILAKASGRKNVDPGENIWLNVDVLNDARCLRSADYWNLEKRIW